MALAICCATVVGCHHRSVLKDPAITSQYAGTSSEKETLVLQAANWERPDPSPPGTPEGDLQIAEALFRDEKYALACKAFKEVADQHKDARPVHERATFMIGEAQFQQGFYAEARDSFEEFRKAYPGSRLVPQAMQRLFAISDSWLDEARDDIRRGKPSTIHRFVHLDPDRKPYFDIDGHAIETLNYVRENDPNGPLADDTLMMTATYHFSMGNYREADQLSDQLIHSYPHSEHQAEAHLINAESKIQSYKGASYDGRKLEEARRTLRSAMNQFPDELQPDRQRVIRELEEIRQEQAKSQFEVGEWYQRMAKRSPGDSDKFNRAARVYYQVVLNNFPGTKWAERAGERLNELPVIPPPSDQPKDTKHEPRWPLRRKDSP